MNTRLADPTLSLSRVKRCFKHTPNLRGKSDIHLGWGIHSGRTYRHQSMKSPRTQGIPQQMSSLPSLAASTIPQYPDSVNSSPAEEGCVAKHQSHPRCRTALHFDAALTHALRDALNDSELYNMPKHKLLTALSLMSDSSSAQPSSKCGNSRLSHASTSSSGLNSMFLTSSSDSSRITSSDEGIPGYREASASLSLVKTPLLGGNGYSKSLAKSKIFDMLSVVDRKRKKDLARPKAAGLPDLEGTVNRSPALDDLTNITYRATNQEQRNSKTSLQHFSQHHPHATARRNFTRRSF